MRTSGERLEMQSIDLSSELVIEYLGYTITRDRTSKTLKLDQFGTVSKLLANFPPKQFGKIPATPYHRKTRDFTTEEESLLSDEDKSIFQQITGSLLYLAICTRGDLLYALHILTHPTLVSSTFSVPTKLWFILCILLILV